MNILRTILFLCAAARHSIGQEDISKYRLPKEVAPVSYALKLQPFIPEGYFKGETFISLKVFATVDAIYLHGSSLNISEVKIVGDLEEVGFKLEKEYELIRVYYENGDQILAGDYILYFKYQGTLLHADQMGMVKAMYSQQNETKVLVVTDFQPTYARRAFPCFDEPALKAVFNVTLVTPNSSWVALTNANEIDHEETPEGVIYRFESTPPMSTDVVSFAITTMDYIENFYQDGDIVLRVRTYLGNAREENQTFVLNFADETVKYFEDFTGIPLPLNKIDFLEYDKKFTATEYWGLTTFKRGILNPSIDLYDTRQISIVVAHELTHYWFGNLVTNKWWSDIWLQEGFAQYLSHKVTDVILNTTNVEQYPLDYTYLVLSKDRDSKNINPVVTNCTTPKEIMVQFNDITYIKAGSLIRLLDFLVGEAGFRKIIKKYFKGFAFRSANTEDFITSVEAVTPHGFYREFLETWLLQNRYPIIGIEDDTENDQYILRQQSFSLFKDTDDMSPYGYKWTLPIVYTTDLKRQPTTVWFKKDDEFITIPKGQENYIKLNYNFMGIYATNYTPSMWDNLIEHVQAMNEIEQTQLAVEAEKLFEAEIINCDVALKIVARVGSEPLSYGLTPISVLYTLKAKLDFDPSAISLLRKLFYSVQNKSKMVRKKEEASKNFIKKMKRSASFDVESKHNPIIFKNREEITPVAIKVPKKKPEERYIRCSKWIHENLSYLL